MAKKTSARERQQCLVELQCSGRLVLEDSSSAPWSYSAQKNWYSIKPIALNRTTVLGNVVRDSGYHHKSPALLDIQESEVE